MMVEHCYADCHIQAFMLSVIMLNVIMLSAGNAKGGNISVPLTPV
jgi:hypothetical protein